ncbi:hypothetical protein [Desulfatitalea alkaliphila]|uniref:Uncharacterized protein n=1 Tax=Desulfatitalea alkaliphila TaxID=2929485 RepID=A0AA41R2D8_9BACT|nr:hypothetical protein [Desulfatitalea alkaliphila]MCJ8499640.1 hypothetical protein [Desulfatitalea alkaliphila]
MNDNPTEPAKKEPSFRFLTPIIATLIASLVATYATYTYNQRQMQLARIEALDKYRIYINSENRAEREYGYFVFEELGYRTLVDKIAEVRDDPAALKILISRADRDTGSAENVRTVEVADRIMRQANPSDQLPLPFPSPPPVPMPEAGKHEDGWVYLGHFVSEKSGWKTRYLNFPVNEPPANLVGKTFEVRRETGALNVRAAMPSIFGQFAAVQEVLAEGSRVEILDQQEWQSSGYMWAKVRFDN